MRRSVSRSTLIALVAALCGCGGAARTGDIQVALAATRPQLFALTPEHTTPSEIVSAVVIVTEIDARVGGAWIPVMTTTQPMNLLKLDNQKLATLGVAKLPTGHIDALRLKLDEIGDYVVRQDGVKKPLEVPANGIVKIEGDLDLDACTAGILVVDFDPRIKTEDEPGRREYELLCSAHLETEELKGACPTGTPDGGDPCSGVICPPGQSCSVQNGMPVCGDPCSGVTCPDDQVCEVQGNQGVCVEPSDGGAPDGGAPDGGAGMDGGCHKHH